jgi:PAS domain S-box-containing protein
MESGNQRNRLAMVELRRQAEDRLKDLAAEKSSNRTLAEVDRLFHELQVYQVELEMQNQELLRNRDELEASLLRYTDLYDFAPVSYFTLDRESVVTSANLCAAGLLGVERSRLLGRHFSLFVAAENRPAFSAFIEKVFADRVLESCEVLLSAGADSVIHVSIEAIACADEEECRLAVIDISERMQAKEARLRSEELNRMTLQSLPAHIAVIDRQGVIIAVNQGWVNFAGDNGGGGSPTVSPGANYCEVCRRVVTSQDEAAAAQALAGIESVLKGECEQFTMEYPCHSPLQQRWFLMTIVPLGPGGIGGAVISHSDITARILAERYMLKSHDELEQRVAERTSELASTVDSLRAEIRERQKAEEALAISAREIEDLYNLAPCGYHSLDKDGTFVRINDTELQWLGYDRDEIVDKLKVTDIQTPESAAVFAVHYPVFLVNKRVSDLRMSFIRKDGSVMPVLLNATAVLDDNGDFLMSRTTMYDISELVAAEESIRKLNLLYLTLSETGKAISRIADRHELFRELCRIVVERGGFRMAWIGLLEEETGLVKPAEAFGFGTDYLQVVRITALPEAEGRGPVGTVVRCGGHAVFNDFLSDPNTIPWQAEAKKRDFLAAASFAIDLHGRNIGALTIYAAEINYFDQLKVDLLVQMQADISFALETMNRDERRREAETALQAETQERLRIVEELRQRELMLLQQNRQAAMGEMINNISHQWRQPLNTLGLIIQKLPICYDSAEFNREYLQENADRAMNLVQHMSRTIDSFRNFFRIDKEIVSFSLNEVVGQVVEFVRQTFEEQNIAITVNVQGISVAHGYPNEYAQVLLNILLNARDALFASRVTAPRIVIAISATDEASIVTITDNGGGIPEEIIGKLFDPYFTTKRPEKGTGIGLFMSKTIIETNMGGTLSVRNAGDGAEFRIEVGNGKN